MIFKPKYNEEEDEATDYFDGPDIPEKPKEPKKPRLTSDNPEYWEEPESEFAHLLPHHPKRIASRTFLIVGILVVLAGIAFFFRYLNPSVTDARQYGYVEIIENTGTLFHSYEGVLLPYKELHDTTRIYTHDFHFTVKDATVAARLKRLQLAGRPVRVGYKRYHATLPWRGESVNIVLAADSVDPATILPPEFRTAPKK